MKVDLDFMVVPEQLQEFARVLNPVRCRILKPELISILGDSGRKLAKAGVEFYFTKELADKLIQESIVVEVNGPILKNEKMGLE